MADSTDDTPSPRDLTQRTLHPTQPTGEHAQNKVPAPSFSTFLRSEPRQRQRVSQNIIAFIGGLNGFASLILWTNIWDKTSVGGEKASPVLWTFAIVTAIVTLLLGLVWYARHATAYGQFVDEFELDRQLKSGRAFGAQVGAAPAGSEIDVRIEANRDELAEYQRQVRRQARTSYVYSQIALAVGLAVLTSIFVSRWSRVTS